MANVIVLHRKIKTVRFALKRIQEKALPLFSPRSIYQKRLRLISVLMELIESIKNNIYAIIFSLND